MKKKNDSTGLVKDLSSKEHMNFLNQMNVSKSKIVDATERFGIRKEGSDEEKTVRVIAFISSDEFHNDSVKNPIGDDWMTEIGNIPQELIDELRKNGWEDANGNVCFPENYQPLPVKGEDGNVYLAMNDTTMSTPAGMGYMMEGIRLLNEE